MDRASPARVYALVIGTTLVVVGLLGFFWNASFAVSPVERDPMLGILDVNGWHNLVHIVTGAVGLAMARTAARAYALGLGVVYLLVFVLGLIVGDGGAILGLIPVNTEDNILHLLIGLAGVAAGAVSPVAAGRPASA